MSKRSRNQRPWQNGPGTRLDAWDAMLQAVLAAAVTLSAKVLASYIVAKHRAHPFFPVIRAGFGGRVEWVDDRGHVRHCRPGLADATDTSRRSMIRARDELVAAGLMGCRRGGGLRTKYCGRGGVGPAAARTAADRPEVLHQVGEGGCKAGGEGLANEYYPLAAAPAPAPIPGEASTPTPRKPLAQRFVEIHGARGP